MGAKYTTLATSGYNGSPPSDAGAQAAENLISWSGIKTKLGDPVKTLADAINTALVSAFDYSVRQITTNDTTVAGDHMRCIEIRNDVSTAVTISLGDAGTMTNLYRVFIKNSSARNQTLTRITGGDTLDGVAGSVVLSPGEGRIVQTNNGATGYVTVSRSGPFTDGDPIVAGGTDGTKKVRLEVDGLTTATTRTITVNDNDSIIGKGPIVQTFTASGTYTPTAGMRVCKVTVVGAGGGSGGCAATAVTQVAAAGGGAAGGASIKTISAATIGASQTVTIGAAGAAGAAGNNSGGTGGTTSLGALLQATGGTGGAGSANITNADFSSGGTGGVGSSGDINIAGQGGGFGASNVAATSSAGGQGGSSILGGGAGSVKTTGSTSGAAGGNFGGGASGSALGQSQSAVAGSAGAAGLVIVEEFF